MPRYQRPRSQVLFCYICLTSQTGCTSVPLIWLLPLTLDSPCEAVSRGRQARRGVDTMSTPFRQHRDVLSKSPAAAHGLVGRSPASAEEGGLSFGDFSLA